MANQIADNEEDTIWTKVGNSEEVIISKEGYYRVEVMNVYNGSIFTFGETSDYFFVNESNS